MFLIQVELALHLTHTLDQTILVKNTEYTCPLTALEFLFYVRHLSRGNPVTVFLKDKPNNVNKQEAYGSHCSPAQQET